MRLAIISDTHLPRGRRRLPEACVERLRSADAVLHAGDFTQAGCTFAQGFRFARALPRDEAWALLRRRDRV